jgi:hypothetical protein
MPNHWSDKVPNVTKAYPYFVNGYGYLYVFDCGYGDRKFNHMSQIFVPKKLSGDPISIYKHFKQMEGETEIKPITSLNRTKGRSENKIIELAKEYHDRDVEPKESEPQLDEPQLDEPQLDEPKTEEPKEPEAHQPNLFEFDDNPHKHDWYRNAKNFVKSLKK